MTKKCLTQEKILSIILLLVVFNDLSKFRYYGVVCELDDNGYTNINGENENVLSNYRVINSESSGEDIHENPVDTKANFFTKNNENEISSLTEKKPTNYKDLIKSDSKFKEPYNINNKANNVKCLGNYINKRNNQNHIYNTKKNTKKNNKHISILLGNSEKSYDLSNNKEMVKGNNQLPLNAEIKKTKEKDSAFSTKQTLAVNDDELGGEAEDYADDNFRTNFDSFNHSSKYKKQDKALVATPSRAGATIYYPKTNEGRFPLTMDKDPEKKNKIFHWRQENNTTRQQLCDIANSDTEHHNHNSGTIEETITNRKYFSSKINTANNKQYSKNNPVNSVQHQYEKNYKIISEPVHNEVKKYKKDDLKQLRYSKNKSKMSRQKTKHEHGSQCGTQYLKMKKIKNAEIQNEHFNKSPRFESKQRNRLLLDVNEGVDGVKKIPVTKFKHRNKNRISQFRNLSDLKETNKSRFSCKNQTSGEKNINTKPEASISKSYSETPGDSNDYNEYEISKTDKEYLSNEKSKMNTHELLSYEQMKDNLNDVDYIEHDSIFHENDPLTTKEQNTLYESFINSGMPNGSSNSTFIDSPHVIAYSNNANVNNAKRKYKRNSESFTNYDVKTNDYISELDYPTNNNKSSYNFDTLNDPNFIIYSDLENNEMLHSEENKNLPETEHQKRPKSYNEPLNEFHDEPIDIYNGKLIKQNKVNFNKENDKEEKKIQIQKHSNEQKYMDLHKQSFDENINVEKLALLDTNHKKKLIQGNKKPHLSESDVEKSMTGITEEKYKLKKKMEQLNIVNDTFKTHEIIMKTTTIKYYGSSKKLQENEKLKYKEHISVKPSVKQCHPPAGPQKFKWCSDDVSAVKDQEYEDTLKGKVALRIVEVILSKVHKSSKMLHDFGFCSSEKKHGKADDDNCDAGSSILKSQDLKDIMTSMEKLSCKSCNQLPPKLKEFLEWLIKVKSVRSVQMKESPFKMHSNCSLGDTAFLFHQYGVSNSYDNQDINGNEQSNYYNSPFEEFDKCDYNQIIKDQNAFDVERSMKNDVDITEDTDNIEQNNLISEEGNDNNQLYNIKSKRYAYNENINYPYSRQSLVPDELGSPYSKVDFDERGIYSNIDNHDNSYNYYEKDKPFESKQEVDQLQNLKSLRKSYINREDEIYSKLYDKESHSDIPYEHLQYKKDNGYKFNEIKNNYDDLIQVRKKRNKNKLPLQEFLTDKQQELNFDELVSHDSVNEELRKPINYREKLKKEPDSYENDQQLGFDTPIVIRIPNEEDSIM